jgi:hypothetical protein
LSGQAVRRHDAPEDYELPEADLDGIARIMLAIHTRRAERLAAERKAAASVPVGGRHRAEP